MTRNAKRLFCALTCAALVAAALTAAHLYPRPAPTAEENKTRYLRAVYVLKSLGGPASSEPDPIPARVIYDDETESLLHHPDKILVLGRLADDLAACGPENPRAVLFEAYARLGMGDRQNAAALLMRHVVMSDYHPGHYALLCRTLYETGDYTSLLIICREWAERDPACREDRALYIFSALFALGRFADAEKAMRDAEPCLGWQAAPHAAKAALAAGDTDRAESLVQEGVRRFASAEIPLRRLWDRLRNGMADSGK